MPSVKGKIPDGFSKDDIIKMLPSALGVFTENQWGPVNTEYLNTVNETLLLNGLSVLDAADAVGINCPEFVRRCSFNKKRFPCFQDHQHFTIRETMTHMGVCCSFNYNPGNSSYQPLNVNSFGIRGGLSIIATSYRHSNNGTSGLLLSDGFVLFMHSPYDFPTEATSMALIEVGKVALVGIYPSKSTVSDDVIALPVDSRRCLTGRDVGLKIYRRAACATKCMTQFVYDKCECHPYFLPAMENATQIRDCVVTDGECFQRIYYDMKKIRCKACMPACEDILYQMTIEKAAYNFEKVTVNPIYSETNWTRNEFTVHIYFARSTVPVFRMFMITSFIGLLANFGGVFNLVLGISIISILELVYYFGIKLLQYVRRSDQIIPVIISNRPANNMLKHGRG
ncbi:hypothetical protein HA402_009730 [Bradysia odoriphaga]|nr:hypothetical protein HA402_009730 [Bradysia odoriphaga]